MFLKRFFPLGRAALLWPALALPLSLSLAATAATHLSLAQNAAQFLQQGEPLKAVNLIAGAPENNRLDPEPELDLLLGIALGRLGRHAEALQPLGRAHERVPQNLEVAENYALALFGTGQWNQALKVFSGLTRKNPDRFQGWLGLGQVENAQGRWKKAEEYFSEACRLQPASAPAWIALADVQTHQGRLQEAAAARQQALNILPHDNDLQLRQAAAWYALGDYAKAKIALQAAGRRREGSAWLLQGLISYRNGDYRAAEEAFKTALEMEETMSEARLNLGIVWFSQGRFEDALSRFESIDIRDAHRAVAQEYARATRDQAAQALLRQGAEFVLKGTPLKAIEYWEKAAALGHKKSENLAVKLLKSLREQSRPQAQEAARRGQVAWTAENIEAAVLEFNGALKLDPANAQALQGLKTAEGRAEELMQVYAKSALADAESGDFDSAQNWTARLLALKKSEGLKLQKKLQALRQVRLTQQVDLGDREVQQGRPGQARRYYEEALSLGGGLQVRSRLENIEREQRLAAGKLLMQALQQERAGDPAAALQTIRRALVEDSQDLEAKRLEARLAEKLKIKRVDAAQVEENYFKGVFLYGAGKTRQALAVWQQAGKDAPDHAPLQQAIRRARLKLQNLEKLERDS